MLPDQPVRPLLRRCLAEHRHSGEGLQWRKSRRSEQSRNCVEIALSQMGVHMRDSKNISGPTLLFNVPAWRTFLADIKSGRFDEE